AAGTQDGTVYLWPAKNDKGLEMSGYSQKVRELAWDATSRRLATGGGPLVIVWDCAGKGPAGREPLGFEGHEQPVTALAFQHRGGWLASTATDGRLLIWQPGTFQRSLGEARIEEGLVRVVWSPSDGRL